MTVFFHDALRDGPLPIPADSPWLRHGVAVFETLLWRGGRLRWAARHLERAAASLAALGLGPLPAPVGDADALAARAVEVLEARGLARATARVNLHLGLLAPSAPPVALVTAAPYPPPPLAPVALTLTGDAVCSPTACHKTAAYLPYRDATRRARAAGAWDAALTDGAGHLTEAATGALLLWDGARRGGPDDAVELGDLELVTPATPWKLPSLALAAVRDAVPVREEAISVARLPRFRSAWLLNSLVGALPLASLGATPLHPEPALAAALRRLAWEDDPAGEVSASGEISASWPRAGGRSL